MAKKDKPNKTIPTVLPPVPPLPTNSVAEQPAPQQGQLQINLDEMRQSKFFIATPCYGGALTEPYFRSVVKMMTFFNGHKIPLAFGTIANESLVTRARNVLLAYFLASDDEFLFRGAES